MSCCLVVGTFSSFAIADMWRAVMSAEVPWARYSHPSLMAVGRDDGDADRRS